MPDSDRARLLPDDEEEEENDAAAEVRSRRSGSELSGPVIEIVSSRVIAAFVVAFHTRNGNVIEWSYPEGVDLEGVEFKALVSGCHVLNRDFVFFRKGAAFGLACYKQLKVDDPAERGARMKAVGVLATSYTSLHTYMSRLFELTDFALHNASDYDPVMAFFRESQADSGSGGGGPELSTSLPKLVITHPAGCFSQMVAFFGAPIITLWKCALLRKRIIFYSPPPIGVVCYRVYCSCFMADHEVLSQKAFSPQPFFYVNVADIEQLTTARGYIACTTEKIFEHKKELYDVFVDNQNIVINSKDEEVRKMTEMSAMDEARFQHLNDIRMSHVYDFSQEQGSDEEEFISYFRELNNRIFTILNDAALSCDRSVTEEHAKAMELDPVKDKAFLAELIKLYGINVILRLDPPCCPI